MSEIINFHILKGKKKVIFLSVDQDKASGKVNNAGSKAFGISVDILF